MHRGLRGIGWWCLAALALLFSPAAALPAESDSITGVVEDTGGNPLVGVQVCASDLDGNWARCGDTDESGFYTIKGLPAADYKVEFDGRQFGFLARWYLDKPDFDAADVVTVAEGATTSGVDAVLPLPGSITGTVRDTVGNPLAGVSACAYDLDLSWGGCGATDASGVYTIGGLPAGSYKVGFDGRQSGFLVGWYPDKPDLDAADTVAVAAGATTSGVDGSLSPGGAITGRVTGEGSGLLEAVTVCAYELDRDEAGCGLTDATGFYTIGGLPTGDYKVEFLGDWSGYVAEWYPDQSDFDTANEVAVSVESTTSGIDASLALSGSITGKVTDADGLPLERVSVCAFGGNRDLVECGYSDASGVYAIDGLPAGGYKVEFDGQQSGFIIEWSLDKTDYYAANTVVVTAGNATSKINASLAQGGSISGTVNAGGSAGEVDVEVYEYSKTGRYWVRRGWTQANKLNGTYRVVGLPAGSFYVSFLPWGGEYLEEYYNGAFVPETAKRVKVFVGVDTPGIDAVLQVEGRIEGTVVAGEGGDLGGGVTVGVYSSEGLVETVDAIADVAGTSCTYSVAGLRPGSYWVKFRPASPAYASEWYQSQRAMALSGAVTVTSGGVTSGIDASLASGGSIAGTVTAAGGEDLGGEVRVYAYDDFGEIAGEGYATNLNSYTYTIDNLQPGDYRLRFVPGPDSGFAAEYHADKTGLPAAAAVAVVADAITTVDAELEAGYRISGAVSAGDGGELGLVQVDIFDLERNLVATTQTDDSHPDTYRTPALKPGGYFVRFTPKAPRVTAPTGLYATEFYSNRSSFTGAAAVAVVGAGGDTVGIDAVFERGGAIEGTVSSSDGESLGARVAVEVYAGAGNLVGQVYADATAGYTYRTDGLLPGTYFVKFVPVPRYHARFYANATVIGSAKPVTVSRGVVTKGIGAVLGGDPPTGTVTINGGEVTRRTAATLTLALTTTGGGGLIKMCISNTANCSTWTAFADTKNWTLPTGNGIKTVNVWFRDQWGNTSEAPHSDTVLLDRKKPGNGTVTVTQSNTQELTLDWGGFGDGPTGSGVDTYKVVFLAGVTAPASCFMGTSIYEGTSTSYTHTGLIDGKTYAYRVCAIDAAGNMSSGATKTGRPVPETNPPSGTVTINGGEVTRRRSTTLTLTATDSSSGAIKMCISNTPTCSAWTAFAGPAMTRSWTLAKRNGTKTVNVWFRDQWGNTSATPYSDTVLLDRKQPVNGTVTVTQSDTQELTLDWGGFDDGPSGSGIDTYKVVFLAGATAPASCLQGTSIYEGTSTSYTHTGLIDGKNYAYRVCAIDAAGNMSTGATKIGRPAP